MTTDNFNRMKYARLSDLLWLWNQQQHFATASVHLRIVDWLELNWRRSSRKMVVNAFRGAGKSSLAALFICWVLYRDPNKRVLILASDERLAQKMLRQVRKIIEQHPLLLGLKPSASDQWSADHITVKRSREWRDPSVLAAGLGGNVTGARADLVICDDVEVPKTAATRQLRKLLREKLAEVDFILTPRGSQLLLGTPHSHESLYSARMISGLDDRSYLTDTERLMIPLLNEKGESCWPQVFPASRIKALRDRQGPQKFASQMLLVPSSSERSRLESARLRRYNEELSYQESRGQGMVRIGGRLMVAQAAAWDPAFGGEKNDASVVACVFGDTKGSFYIHDVHYLRTDFAADEDAASAQCLQVIDFIKRNYLRSIIVENNGLGRFLPQRLRVLLRRKGLGDVAVLSRNTRVPKNARITQAFDALLASRRLFINEKLLDSDFIVEFSNWHAASCENDDGLDAVAHCLLAQPIRAGVA